MNQAEAARQGMYLLWALGAVMAVNLGLAAIALTRRARGEDTFAPRWSLLDPWVGTQLILSLLLFAMVPLGIAAALLGGMKLDDFDDLSSPKMILYFLLPGAILQNVIFFGVPAAWINLKYRLPLRAIGLPPLPSRRDICAGLLLGVLGLLISSGLEVGLTAAAQNFRHIDWVDAALRTDKQNPVADIIKVLPRLGVPGLALAVLGIGLGAPFGEEMLFRGWLFNAAKGRLGLAAALIVSALVFTLPHSYGFGLVAVFTLGLLLAWSYHCSGSLWVPIFLHATVNTTSVLVAFFFPHLAR